MFTPLFSPCRLLHRQLLYLQILSLFTNIYTPLIRCKKIYRFFSCRRTLTLLHAEYFSTKFISSSLNWSLLFIYFTRRISNVTVISRNTYGKGEYNENTIPRIQRKYNTTKIQYFRKNHCFALSAESDYPV